MEALQRRVGADSDHHDVALWRVWGALRRYEISVPPASRRATPGLRSSLRQRASRREPLAVDAGGVEDRVAGVLETLSASVTCFVSMISVIESTAVPLSVCRCGSLGCTQCVRIRCSRTDRVCMLYVPYDVTFFRASKARSRRSASVICRGRRRGPQRVLAGAGTSCQQSSRTDQFSTPVGALGSSTRSSGILMRMKMMAVGAVRNRVLCGFASSGGRALCVHGSGCAGHA